MTNHISPKTGVIVNVGATELAALCNTLGAIGSRDLIGAVQVEGKVTQHLQCVISYLFVCV
jgi:hypothetical protein